MKHIVKALLLVSIVVTGLFSPVTPYLSLEPTNTGYTVAVEIEENIAYAQNSGYLYESCSGGVIDEATCTLKNALLGFFEYLWYYSTMIVAFLAGFASDILIFHSISSATYRTGIVEAGWEILRNLINIIFIFSLLFIAFKMVFGSDSSGVKKTLIKTIVIALIVNFSLFMSYVIIDASNILGNIFYNRITVEGSSPDLNEGQTSDEIEGLMAVNEFFTGNSSFKSPSSAIVSKFNPQNIVAGAGGSVTFAQKWMIIFAAGGINILMILLFVSILMLFLTRTVGLMIAAILSPLAFVTLTLPSGNATNIPYIGFNVWLKDLISLSFMAPVYLFFLYLTVMFANNDALFNSINVGSTGGFLTSILVVFISFGLIAMILLTAKRIAKDMSGTLGGKIADGLTKAATGAAMVAGTGAAILATGGAAALGGVARGAGAATGSQRLSSIGKNLQTTKFDISKMPGFNQTIGQTGIGKSIAKGVNTSYADVDTTVRKNANLIRSRVDDVQTGRAPESVQNWQKKVQESRNELTGRRIENAQRKAVGETKLDAVTQESYLPGDVTPVNAVVTAMEFRKNANGEIETFKSGFDQGLGELPIEKAIERKQAELARRSSEDAKIEKDGIDNKKKEIQAEIDVTQDKVDQLRKDPESSPEELKKERENLEKLKEHKIKIEETTLTGQIKQLEKMKERQESEAQSGVLKKDVETRNTTQDSNMVVANKARQERVEKQASEVGSGKIKTSSKVGGDANNVKPGN